MTEPDKPPMLPNEVVAKGCRLLGLTASEVFSDRRLAPIHRVRVTMYAALRLRMQLQGKEVNVSQIGRTMRRDHSTVLHGLEKADYLLAKDPDFAKDVLMVATLGMPGYAQPEEPPCNPPLQVVVPVDQQQERSMTNPEYTEKQINAALDVAGLKNIRAYWDGEVVTRDEPPVFEVFLDDDGTGVYITDTGPDFDVQRRCSDRVFRPVGNARTFGTLAEVLREEFAEEREAA